MPNVNQKFSSSLRIFVFNHYKTHLEQSGAHVNRKSRSCGRLVLLPAQNSNSARQMFKFQRLPGSAKSPSMRLILLPKLAIRSSPKRQYAGKYKEPSHPDEDPSRADSLFSAETEHFG
jgi:hypothetical protein